MPEGSELLQFRCTGCGACCRSLRVAITHYDLSRLHAKTALDVRELADWLAPEHVDMTGEPGSFVRLREGRRLMVLAQRAGGCRLLGPDDRCTAYDARPADCRLFPFDAEFRADGSLRRLALLPLAGCDYRLDGTNDSAALQRDDERRWHELSEYQALVASWNRIAGRRERLGRLPGAVSEFLTYLGV